MNPEVVMQNCIAGEGAVKRKGRHVLYTCPSGKWTAGYGRNLEDNGLSDDEAKFLLRNDVMGAADDLDRNVPWWRRLTPNRQDALCELCFMLGWPRLRKFKDMLSALERGEYAVAKAECLDSLWADQMDGKVDGKPGARALRIAEALWKG